MATGQMIVEGLKILGIGVGIVFIVLALFYFILRLLMRIWPAKDID